MLTTHSIHSLTLTSFRNYPSLSLEAGGESVVLTGHNGAGKTNILEAISFLAPGRGLRRAKLGLVDCQHSGEPWTVHASAHGKLGEVSVGTGRDASEQRDKRRVRIDGTEAKSANELTEYLTILWLTPQMDQLFLEGNTARRKFLDRLVYGFDAAHARRVNAYETATRERNRLLVMHRSDAIWLSAAEQKIAELGVAMTIARREAISHINAMMQASDHGFPTGQLQLSGEIEMMLEAGKSALEAEEKLRDLLAQNRPVDREAGRTLIGAHRSQLTVTHSQKNMEAAFCSTGEQKALLLAIVLAEAQACKHFEQQLPILLLDEVAAHLDPSRRSELYARLDDLGCQVWMSGVSDDLFQDLTGSARFFNVEDGAIKA